MVRVILHGCSGRMGRALANIIAEDEDMSIVAGVDKSIDTRQPATPFPIFGEGEKCDIQADVIIDFSHKDGVLSALKMAEDMKLPIVVATTGLTGFLEAQLINSSKQIPIFKSANMSLGINLVSKAIKDLTPHLEENFNVEIIEKHHIGKKDSPSGTALLLADAVNQASSIEREYVYGRKGNEDDNQPSQIGIHAVRGGTIVGEHTVIFAGPDEIIEVKHTALSRDVFARGAISGAKFILGKDPGFYNMEDLVGEINND